MNSFFLFEFEVIRDQKEMQLSRFFDDDFIFVIEIFGSENDSFASSKHHFIVFKVTSPIYGYHLSPPPFMAITYLCLFMLDQRLEDWRRKNLEKGRQKLKSDGIKREDGSNF